MAPPPADKPVSVLFVCLGNYCRSPMAEAVFAHIVKQNSFSARFSRIDGAGTSGYHVGDPPDERTVEECRRHKVPIDSRGRRVKGNDFDEFDYIFGMDTSNVRNLKSMQPEGSKALVRMFGDVDDKKVMVDPWYDSGSKGFQVAFEQCVRYSNAFLRELGLSPSTAQL